MPSVTTADGAVVEEHPGAGDILETRDLRRAFEGVSAVDGVTLSFAQGRLTGVIGPNGAGKSTVLPMLTGTVVPTGGQVLYRGDDITALPPFQRARAGIVRTFQLASEFKRLTVLENLLSSAPRHPGDSLAGALLASKRWRRREEELVEEALALLDRFRLARHADDYAGELSGGQRRLVEIMRALMARPTVLLLDEPMAGVHPRLAEEIGTHLEALRDEGMTIIMVEHELGSVERLCDPVIVMATGRVLAQGTMSELRQRQDVLEAYLVG